MQTPFDVIEDYRLEGLLLTDCLRENSMNGRYAGGCLVWVQGCGQFLQSADLDSIQNLSMKNNFCIVIIDQMGSSKPDQCISWVYRLIDGFPL